MVTGLSFQRRSDRPLELGRVFGDEVGQLAVLRMTPPRLDRVELGCIGGQPFELDALGARLLELLGRGPMDLPTIPDDDQWPAQLPPELLDERNRRRRADAFFVNLERQADLPAP